MCNSMKHVPTPVELRALAVSDGAVLFGAACLLTALVSSGIHEPKAMLWSLGGFVASLPVIFVCGAVAQSEGGWPGRLALVAAFGVWFVFALVLECPRRILQAISHQLKV